MANQIVLMVKMSMGTALSAQMEAVIAKMAYGAFISNFYVMISKTVKMVLMNKIVNNKIWQKKLMTKFLTNNSGQNHFFFKL